jgi:CubicO group peptidase (beta-lactamase class C family)
MCPALCLAFVLSSLVGWPAQEPDPARRDPAAAQSPAQDPRVLADKILALVNEHRNRLELQGLSFAVGQGDEPLVQTGLGYLDASAGVVATETTAYRIGPLARVFTAVAALQLVDEKKLDPRDELSKLVPGFPTQEHKVTLHHLLSHTSGIPGYGPLGKEWRERGRVAFTQPELLQVFKDQPFEFSPGERFAPSNSGYTLLSVIVESKTGQPFTEYVRRQILLPLGLRDTTYCDALPPPKAEAADQGPAAVPAAVQTAPIPASQLQILSMEDLCSSARDLYAWQRALAGRKLLSEESQLLLTAPVLLPDGRDTHHGYGLVQSSPDGVKRITHGIDEELAHATIAYYPDADLTIVLLAAPQPTPVEERLSELERRIARTVLDLPEPTVVDKPLTPEERALYAGGYQLGSTRLVIADNEGRLELQWAHEPTLHLLFQGQHTFATREEPETRLIFQLHQDRVEQFVLRRKGFESVVKRFD